MQSKQKPSSTAVRDRSNKRNQQNIKQEEDMSRLLSKALAKCEDLGSIEGIDQLKSLADMLQTKINHAVLEKNKKNQSNKPLNFKEVRDKKKAIQL